MSETSLSQSLEPVNRFWRYRAFDWYDIFEREFYFPQAQTKCRNAQGCTPKTEET